MNNTPVVTQDPAAVNGCLGASVTFTVADKERAEKLLRNMSAVAEIQSAIALIRKHQNGTRTGVQQFVANQPESTTVASAGTVRSSSAVSRRECERRGEPTWDARRAAERRCSKDRIMISLPQSGLRC